MTSIIELEEGLNLIVGYTYTPMEISNDPDLPNEPANVEIINTELSGDILPLLMYVDDKEGKFIDWLEAKLLEINE